jgi:hypothetical protein
MAGIGLIAGLKGRPVIVIRIGSLDPRLRFVILTPIRLFRGRIHGFGSAFASEPAYHAAHNQADSRADWPARRRSDCRPGGTTARGSDTRADRMRSR